MPPSPLRARTWYRPARAWPTTAAESTPVSGRATRLPARRRGRQRGGPAVGARRQREGAGADALARLLDQPVALGPRPGDVLGEQSGDEVLDPRRSGRGRP